MEPGDRNRLPATRTDSGATLANQLRTNPASISLVNPFAMMASVHPPGLLASKFERAALVRIELHRLGGLLIDRGRVLWKSSKPLSIVAGRMHIKALLTINAAERDRLG